MTVLALSTTQVGDGYRAKPTEHHGKLRFMYFDLPATAAAGEATTTIDLCDLPPGRVRVLPWLSRLSHSAFGAGATVDIGHTAYPSRDPGAGDAEAADPDAFTPAGPIDVAAAANSIAFDQALKFDVYSRGGVRVQAVVAGADIPEGATLSGFVAYIYE